MINTIRNAIITIAVNCTNKCFIGVLLSCMIILFDRYTGPLFIFLNGKKAPNVLQQ